MALFIGIFGELERAQKLNGNLCIKYLFSVWREALHFPANWETCRFFTLEADTLHILLTGIQSQNLYSFFHMFLGRQCNQIVWSSPSFLSTFPAKIRSRLLGCTFPPISALTLRFSLFEPQPSYFWLVPRLKPTLSREKMVLEEMRLKMRVL